jgi:RNA polymerase sigma factor (sigma-70 family)
VPRAHRKKPEFAMLNYTPSLNDKVSEDMDVDILDTLCVEHDFDTSIAQEQARNKMLKYMSWLSPREEQVVKGIFYDNMTAVDVAKRMEITDNRVRDLYNSSMRKMKRFILRDSKYSG